MYRPRDIVEFFNCCIASAVDRPNISVNLLRQAEQDYSVNRFRSLGDEWVADYPEILDVIGFFKNYNSNFLVQDIDDERLSDFCLALGTSKFGNAKQSEIFQRAYGVASGGDDLEDFKRYLVRVLHLLGVFGLKISTTNSVQWSFKEDSSVSSAEISDETGIYICPMFYRVLGINPKT